MVNWLTNVIACQMIKKIIFNSVCD
uniref:Uncharacterized protein n=1 Tax=Tetranychus urticae TaxID=32264 RepID=T1JXK4_TETUR